MLVSKIIPTVEYANYTQDIVLSGVVYNIEFIWNNRAESWNISFYDTNNNVLVEGIKLVLNYELISDFCDRGLPNGELWAVDITGNNEKIKYEDLNNGRILLVYREEVEE